MGGGLRRGCQRRVKIAPVSTAKRGDADHSGEGFLLELRSRVERLSGDHLDSLCFVKLMSAVSALRIQPGERGVLPFERLAIS